ncbi:hypothetical protein AAC387_Pa08g1172 [Persea americana]
MRDLYANPNVPCIARVQRSIDTHAGSINEKGGDATRKKIREDALPGNPSLLRQSPKSFNYMILMSSRSTVTSAVSCKLGNKNNFWVLGSLLPGFLGALVAYDNFQLRKAIVRNPSSSICISSAFGGCKL